MCENTVTWTIFQPFSNHSLAIVIFAKRVKIFVDVFAVLMKCFNGFCKDGVVQASTVESILDMMGLRVQKEALDAIIAEVDEDGKVSMQVFPNRVSVANECENFIRFLAIFGEFC